MRTLPASTALVLLCSALPGLAQWSSDPTNNLLVTDVDTNHHAKMAATPDGGCYVTWFDSNLTGNDLRLQRYDRQGNKMFPPEGLLVGDLNTSTNWLVDPDIAVDEAGHAWLIFRNASNLIAARVAPDGSFLWGASGIQIAVGSVTTPTVTITSTGDAVFAWAENGDAHVRKLDANGQPLWASDVVLCPPSGNYEISDLITSGDDTLLALVNDYTGPPQLLLQKFSPLGIPLWAPGPVTVYVGGCCIDPSLFPPLLDDGAGGAVLAWYDDWTEDCSVQHILQDGTAAFPQNGVTVSTADRSRRWPTAHFDAISGNTTVFWTESYTGGIGEGIGGQKLSASGARLWGPEGRIVEVLTYASVHVLSTPTPTGSLVFWFTGIFTTLGLGTTVDASGENGVGFQFGVGGGYIRQPRAITSVDGFTMLTWSNDGGLRIQSALEHGAIGPVSLGAGYCPITPNSAGSGAALFLDGSTSSLANDLELRVSSAVPGQPGIFFYGDAQVQMPMGNGNRCVSGSTVRLWPPVYPGGAGFASRALDNTSPAIAGSLSPIANMASLNFQFWYRDPSGGGAGYNLSNAIAVTFTP
jgi:hypothetical protein